MRAFSLVNCQSMVAFLLLRRCCHCSTSDMIVSISLILRFRHCLPSTLNSISQMFSQLPCTGVKCNSSRSANLLASSAGKVSYREAILCVLRLSRTRMTFFASGYLSSSICRMNSAQSFAVLLRVIFTYLCPPHPKALLRQRLLPPRCAHTHGQ